jgi:ABC-2 type transport system permease protein
VVAHLLRLKLALLRNGLRRGVSAIIGMVVGVLYGGGFVLVALVVLVSLRWHGDPSVTRTVVVLAGAGLMAGWALLPVVLFGIDPTLDPVRFATFAVPERTLAVGLALTGLVGLPGLGTLLLVLGLVVATSLSVASTLVGVVAGAMGLAACVLLSRIVTGAAATVLATRRGRDVAGLGGFLLVMVLVPALSSWGHRGPSPALLQGAAGVVAWTPLGWPWAAAASAALGDWGAAMGQLVLAAGWCLLLFWTWQRVLVGALRNPRTATSASTSRGGLGLFARLPATPMGAIAARAGTYWVRDPRLNLPAVMTILLPGGMLVPGIGSGSMLALAAMPVASAYLIGWGQHNDVGYDSTAFWMHVAAGVDGRSDRLGRLFPSGLIALFCVPGYAVLGALAAGSWRLFPASLGAGMGVALSGFAVACVTSAVKQYAVPAPGENPFSSRPGSVGVTMAVQTVCGLSVVALSLPVLALATMAWFQVSWAPWAPWAALVVGPVVGLAVLTVGVRAGSELFRRRQADLLHDLVSMR